MRSEVVIPYPGKIQEQAQRDLLSPQEFMRRKITTSLVLPVNLGAAKATAVKIDVIQGSIRVVNFFPTSEDCQDYIETANAEALPLSDEDQIKEFYLAFNLDGTIIQPSQLKGRKKTLER